MRTYQAILTLVATGATLLLAADARAQTWGRPAVPARGACFYEDINYGGQYFCASLGARADRVPPGTNDQISSIRVFGQAQVTVYRDERFRGSSRRFTSNVNDLGRAGWNDLISSFGIEERSNDNTWGGGGAYGSGNGGGGNNPGYGGGYGGGWGGAYGGGSHGGWGTSEGGNRWTYQQAEEIVRRAYLSTLGREPDPAARSWINEVMKNDMTQRQLEAELRKSQEYVNKRGG